MVIPFHIKRQERGFRLDENQPNMKQKLKGVKEKEKALDRRIGNVKGLPHMQ